MSRFLAFKQANWPSLQNAMLTSSAVVAFTPRILLPECLPGRVGCEADALRLLPLRPERRRPETLQVFLAERLSRKADHGSRVPNLQRSNQ
jgi:hypothetical protein